jgi:hypothetical protein
MQPEDFSPDTLRLNPELQQALAASAKVRVKGRAGFVHHEGFDSKLEKRAWTEWVPGQGAAGAFLHPFVLHLTGGNYTPDIVLLMPDGELRVIEVKGSWSADLSGRSSKRNLEQAAIEFAWLARFYSLMPVKPNRWELKEYGPKESTSESSRQKEP